MPQKRSLALVSILQGLAAAEIADGLHLRDFRSPAIFEFFNTIRQKRASLVSANGGSRFGLRSSSSADKSLIRPCALEKRLEDVEHFIWLIVVKPVARALDLDQFGLLEMRDHAGRPGIG